MTQMNYKNSIQPLAYLNALFTWHNKKIMTIIIKNHVKEAIYEGHFLGALLASQKVEAGKLNLLGFFNSSNNSKIVSIISS